MANKSLAIIGAGPGGLITALTFLKAVEKFDITVFESNSEPGGMWPTSRDAQAEWKDPTNSAFHKLDPLMKTNLSRSTVDFGEVEDGYGIKSSTPDEKAGVFPEAWQVGRYLKRMADDLASKGVEFKYNTKVKLVEDGSVWEGKRRWTLTTVSKRLENGNTWTVEQVFAYDYLIIASGFFHKPYAPPALKPLACNPDFPVYHASTWRADNTKNFLKTIDKGQENMIYDERPKVLVVGGSMTGVEVAAHLADALTSRCNLKAASYLELQKQFDIHHVASKPFWVLPRYVPVDPEIHDALTSETRPNPAPTFLPVDNVLFDLLKRPKDDRFINKSGVISPETAAKTQEFYAKLTGQPNPHGADILGEKPNNEVPLLAISDNYNNHIRDSVITLQPGHLRTLTGTPTTGLSATLSGPNGSYSLSCIALVILATGYENGTSLDMLSARLQKWMGYDASSPMPIELCWHSTMHKNVSELGFVGMYKGAFWGVMEQQAGLLCHYFQQGPPHTLQDDAVVSPVPEFRRMKALGRHLARGGELDEGKAEHRGRVTHFPMADYVHVVSDLMRLRNINPPSEPEPDKDTICIPFIPLPSMTPALLHTKQLAAQALIDRGSTGAFLPRTLFRSLNGSWYLHKRIETHLADGQSGTFTGSATFRARAPTAAGVEMEYVYEEFGMFTRTGGVPAEVRRAYVYRLSEPCPPFPSATSTSNSNTDNGKDTDPLQTQRITAHFVRPLDASYTVTGLFHEIAIIRPGAESGRAALDGEKKALWRGKSWHLCERDVYEPEYWWEWHGGEVRTWGLAFVVGGPRKDFVIGNVFER